MWGCSLTVCVDAGSQALHTSAQPATSPAAPAFPQGTTSCLLSITAQQELNKLMQPAGLASPPTGNYPYGLSAALICPFPAQLLPVEPAALGKAWNCTQQHGHTPAVTIHTVELCTGCYPALTSPHAHCWVPAGMHKHPCKHPSYTHALSDLFASYKSLQSKLRRETSKSKMYIFSLKCLHIYIH